MDQTLAHGALMDRIYRWQRRFGIYDATRKHYLLGRDPMLAGLAAPRDGTVLEIGCGTGRNLVRAAHLYPGARFHGIDISHEMLAAAGAAVARAGLPGRIRLAYADATAFDPVRTFGRDSYDRIFMSYAASMIPRWRVVMSDAAERLAPGGELHVADFGDMRGLPRPLRAGMERWLGWHHVSPRLDLFSAASECAAKLGGTAECASLHRGFSWIAIIRRP